MTTQQARPYVAENERNSGNERNTDRIPVRNWWHMLLYAWDLVELEGLFDAKWESAPNLRELLTRILVELTNRQIRRGLRGDYVDRSEPLKMVRGRIDFNRTLSDLLMYKGQLHCEYQEYSLNVPRNQIIATTLQRQSRSGFEGLNNDQINALKFDVERLVRTMDGIDRVELDRSLISNEMQKLGPNEREYKLMLRVCEMLYMPKMPMDSEDDVSDDFRDWVQQRENEIFEQFVANFCMIELQGRGWNVASQTQQRWNETGSESIGDARLPTMRPDIVLTHRESGKIVVADTKWYRSVVSERFGTPTVHSSNLYQMYAYLASQDHRGTNHRGATGILLYAQTTKHDLDFRTKIDGHPFWVYTLNLNQKWEGIEADLRALVEDAVGEN